jgi:hypothetical protein
MVIILEIATILILVIQTWVMIYYATIHWDELTIIAHHLSEIRKKIARKLDD